MKRVLMICLLAGFSFVFLVGRPTKANACNVSCDAWGCALVGDVDCGNGQYMYAPNGGSCPSGLPDTCTPGSGGWWWEEINGVTSCTLQDGACTCPYSNFPTMWEVYSGC
jgi:hypothetical protein